MWANSATLILGLTTCLTIFKAQSIASVTQRTLRARSTFFIYEKSAIFLIFVKSDLYLLPSLPLAIQKHWCEFQVDI